MDFQEFKSSIHRREVQTLHTLKQTLDLSWLTKKDYRIINTHDQLDWVIRKCWAAPIIALDTETTGVNICNLPEDSRFKDHMVGMSLSWERNQGVYIPFDHTEFKNMELSYALRKLKPLLTKQKIITHNGLFDGKVFYDLGIKLNITQDTLLMHFSLDSRVGKGTKALKSIVRRMYGYDVIELSDIFKHAEDYGMFRYVGEELCKAYACADSDHTFMVFMDTFPALLPSQLKSYTLDIRVQNNLIRSEYFGKGINIQLLNVLDEINNRDIQAIGDFVFTYVGTYLNYKHTGQLRRTKYKFNISSSQDLTKILFNLLEYPIPPGLENKKLSVDKHTLKAVIKLKSEESDPILDFLLPEPILTSAVDYPEMRLSRDSSDALLISKEAVGDKLCKVAVWVQQYRKLFKLKGTFFSMLVRDQKRGKLFSGIKMANAETARLVDIIQTLDKLLKKAIVPLETGEYLIDFDFAQMEYRVMVGLANMPGLKLMLDNPEKDYHREGGKLILGKPAEDIDDDERKDLKAVNFGIPYQMSAQGIVDSKEGLSLSKEEKAKAVAETEELLRKWEDKMYPISNMLNTKRREALIPIEDYLLPDFLKGSCVGKVENAIGRRRLFDLSNMSSSKKASIGRQAGNYPIQSFAREIFCESFCDFSDACIREELMDIKIPDETKPLGYRYGYKVAIMAYIHDECLMSIAPDVNPHFIYKLIYENCMKEITNHPRYYCGINVITNWYEGKSSKFEAPVRFVMEQVALNPPKLIMPRSPEEIRDSVCDELKEYALRRTEEELLKISPMTAQGIYDMSEIVPRFKDYHVRPLVLTYLKPCREIPKKPEAEVLVPVIVETLLRYRGKPAIIKQLDNTYLYLTGEENESVVLTDPESVLKEESTFRIAMRDEAENEIQDEINITDAERENFKMNAAILNSITQDTTDLFTFNC